MERLSQVQYIAGVMADKIPITFLFAETAESVETLEQREKRERRMAAWLDAVGAQGWRRACEIAQVSEPQVHRWLRLFPDFAAAHRATQTETAARLERIADEIADGSREGNPSQVTLLQFRLRGLRPETYRDRSSVTVDATTRVVDGGDAGRARALLAEWGGTTTVISGTATPEQRQLTATPDRGNPAADRHDPDPAP